LSIGEPDNAAQDARRILQMTSAGPSPLVNSHAAKILYAAGKYDESEELLVRIREMVPEFYIIHWQLGLLYGVKGNFSAAHDSLERAFKLCPQGPGTLAALGWANALAGKVNAAKKIAERLEADRRHQYVPSIDLAMIYAVIGEMDLAFAFLNRAYQERALFLPWLRVWPPFMALCGDPRSIAILNKMGLKGTSSGGS
jgi:tetratricopeptide (TPR) repeat protein